MGHGRVGSAVVDAGSIIHLAEIGCLSLLRTFEALCIPHAVWSETVGQECVLQNDVLGIGNVQSYSPSRPEVLRFAEENRLAHLQDGEKECLYLCQHINVTVLLTDDLSVRKAAKHLKLTPVGSLGIVVKAYQQERIPLKEAERHIADLYDVSSLFVTRAIVELAIEHLHGFLNQK